MTYCIIAILIFILTYFLWLTTTSKTDMEYFDAKITNATKVNCGVMCTKLMDCKGFMVGSNNVCYLSKTPILGSPTDSVFGKEYDSNIERCNKYGNVNDITTVSEMDKKKNATYICVPDQIHNNQEYRIYDTTEKIIYSLNDIENINVENYTFIDMDWNKEMKLEDYPKLISNPDQQEKTSITLLTEYTDEHLGQYMFEHKCSANISQYDCVKFCLNNPDCVGTEWNPIYTPQTASGEYELHRNVCCPKRQIIQSIPRREEFKNGHFYLKEQVTPDKIGSNILVNFGVGFDINKMNTLV